MNISAAKEQHILPAAPYDLTHRSSLQTAPGDHLLPLLHSSTASPKAIGLNHSPNSQNSDHSLTASAEEMEVRKLKTKDSPNSGRNVGSGGQVQDESDYLGPEALWRAALAANWGSHPFTSAGLRNSELLREEERLNVRKAPPVDEETSSGMRH